MKPNVKLTLSCTHIKKIDLPPIHMELCFVVRSFPNYQSAKFLADRGKRETYLQGLASAVLCLAVWALEQWTSLSDAIFQVSLLKLRMPQISDYPIM